MSVSGLSNFVEWATANMRQFFGYHVKRDWKKKMFFGRREINAYHNVHTELFIIRKYLQTDRDTIRNANESVVRLNFSVWKLAIQLLWIMYNK